MRRKVVMALAALVCVLLTTTALAAEGLDSFTESRSMDGGTFTDVKTGNWFYSGVKAAYDMEIMEGVGGNAFAPTKTVSWSQAVTIAARVRAAYLGEEIPSAEGSWYQRYVDYAEACGILPEDHPQGSAWNTTAIDRQSIAYLFQAVVDSEDCPAISDLTIPDLEQVDEDKKEAVQTLYAAGIFTGKGDGSFEPAGQTTRGELATILCRLLRPADRVAHDSRINADMVGQESNFTHSGGLCYDDEAVYLIYRKESYDTSGKGVWSYHILRRDKATGVTTTLYTSDVNNLENLTIADGVLYFAEKTSSYSRVLRSLDLSTGAVAELCTTPKSNHLDYFIIYDGKIYTLQQQMTASYDFVYTLGEMPLSGGSIRELGKYDRVDSIYGFNGKIYVAAEYSHELHAYDLATGKTELLLEKMEDCVFQNGTVYFLQWDKGGYSKQVWMASLESTDRPVKYGTVPESACVEYVNLAHDGTNLYYIASGEGVLYRIVPGQVAEKAAATIWKTVEDPILWDDCFLQGNSGLYVGGNYTGEYPVTVGMGRDSMYTVNVDYWLGYSAMMKRVELPQTGSAYVDNESMEEDARFTVRKAYYSGDALVLDVDVRNLDTDKSMSLQAMEITASADGVALAQEVQVVYAETLRPGKASQLTVVLQGDDLLAAGVDLSDLHWEIQMMYRL